MLIALSLDESQHARVIAFFGKIDMEISELSGDEARHSSSPTVRNDCSGSSAYADFVNKFIRAEVVHYDDFIAAEGSFAKAKDAPATGGSRERTTSSKTATS